MMLSTLDYTSPRTAPAPPRARLLDSARTAAGILPDGPITHRAPAKSSPSPDFPLEEARPAPETRHGARPAESAQDE